MKKFVSLVLVTILCVALLAGCGSVPASSQSGNASFTGEEESSKSDVTVRIGWLGVQDNEQIDPVSGIVTPGKDALEKFLSEKTGYNIEIVSIIGGDWIQQTETLIKSGEIDMARYTNQTQIPTWFEDITPYIAKDPDLGNGGLEKTFIDYAQYYMKYRSFEYPENTGMIYGLPLSMTNTPIVYDSVLFEQWGVTPPENGCTFEDLLETAKKMTGTNPVTGEQNYGMYIRSDRTEFIAISFDALKPVEMETMDISQFDTDMYVENLKDSPELLKYFQWLEEVVKIAPSGISTNTGNELWLTEENNIAINVVPVDNARLYNQYYRGGIDEITSRYKTIDFPLSSDGMEGFPEFQFMGISQYSDVKDAAWEVLKVITLDPEFLDYFSGNYVYASIPVLKDISALEYTNNPSVKERYEYQRDHGFLTNDYWHFRIPIQPVISEMLAGTISPEDARQKTYEEVKKWVENRALLAG